MAKLDRIILNGVTYTLGGGDGLTDSVKSSMLQVARNIPWDDQNGRTYYDVLYAALYPPADLESISAVYTQSGTVYDTDTLESLKANLVVTAHMSDSTTQAVTNYTLSGTLTAGTSTITVSYGGKDATFNVAVTHYEPIAETVSWTGGGTESTSTAIDATERDVYIEVPFDSSDSRIKSGATAEDLTFAERATLYTDSACTQIAGYWFIDTRTVESAARIGANLPYVPFDDEIKIAPKGYYVKVMLEKRNTTVFDRNGDAFKYLKDKVTSVTLR